MKTKGKGNEPQKKACKPSPNFDPLHPEKLRFESLKGDLTVDQVKRCPLFLKMVYMEEWKAGKDISWVKWVRLSSFYRQDWDDYHERIAREFVCN
jgi:hypothetical protein